MPGGVSVENPEAQLAVSRLHLRASRRHRCLQLGELTQMPDDLVSHLTAGAPVLAHQSGSHHIKTTIREEEK